MSRWSARRAWCWRQVAAADYGWAVPALARLPRPLARPLWMLRGLVNAAMDWDWRTLSLGHGYVRRSTMLAMRAIRAHATQRLPPAPWLTLRRYLCASREEVDCWRLQRFDAARVRVHGLEPVLRARDQGRGLVLMTGHFDSLYVGLAALARAGLRVNVMSSAITQQDAVPPAIRRHHQRKIDALNALLAPARVAHFEDGLGFFVRALRRGEVVLIACDGPSTSDKRAAEVDFLGARRPMAPGPQALAELADAPLAMYCCRETHPGRFEVEISEPHTLAEDGLQRAYAVFERQLLAEPWRWWAADLYPTYQAAARERAQVAAAAATPAAPATAARATP